MITDHPSRLLCLSFILLVAFTPIQSQTVKPALSPSDYDQWKRIEHEMISPDGRFVVYHEIPGFGDPVLRVMGIDGSQTIMHHRAKEGVISADSKTVVFRISPPLDTIRALKRRGTNEEDIPCDTLAIYHYDLGSLWKIPYLNSFKVPEKWGGFVTYLLDEIEEEKDTTLLPGTDSIKTSKPKKVSEKNGFHLVVRNTGSLTEDTLSYVKAYSLAEKNPFLIYETSGIDSLHPAGIYWYDLDSGNELRLYEGEKSFYVLNLDQDGQQAAFVVNEADEKDYVPDYRLMYWMPGMDTAKVAVQAMDLDNNTIPSPYMDVTFSENGQRLFFGAMAPPLIKDTTLLEDEIIQVEVWTYKDQRLQTQQEVEKKRDEERSFMAVYHVESGEVVHLGDEEVPDISFGQDEDRNHQYVFGRNAETYRMEVSWDGFPLRQDIYMINVETGDRHQITEGVRGNGDISPGGRYLYWFNVEDTAYYSYNIAHDTIICISAHIPTSIVDELDDHPDYPSPYGFAGWTLNDDRVMIYDRFDIWEVNPMQPDLVVRMTQGRENKNRYRVEKLDEYRPYIDLEDDVMVVFNEASKAESLVRRNGDGVISSLAEGDMLVRDISKAKHQQRIIFSMQNHTTSPDLHTVALDGGRIQRLSDANPHQMERRWSTVELIKWTSLDGIELEGLLYKPEGFDPSQKYPMIVYFYERNAHTLNRYWGAFPHRSIINPSYYASRGYLVFIPDIVYRDGYPGPSCFNAVIPGVTSLIDKGFVDKSRVGMQGHSWGGYQTAYLATRTNLFACAESGAPVANMTSAYGGIRWGTGLSRMFQYEHTQSRLGGSLWEVPLRYFENSPIFFADKISTPMLLMHNDHDTAVPWYQGIELFVALRRLGKPVWMLNYNDEPHWPTKRENIIDFNIRMQQFFDHYLMGKEQPRWMQEGIPAVRKGYDRGYD